MKNKFLEILKNANPEWYSSITTSASLKLWRETMADALVEAAQHSVQRTG
jgi:hypothetical protein